MLNIFTDTKLLYRANFKRFKAKEKLEKVRKVLLSICIIHNFNIDTSYTRLYTYNL